MRFLIDMNLAPRWVPTLLAAGHDAVHLVHSGAGLYIGFGDLQVCTRSRFCPDHQRSGFSANTCTHLTGEAQRHSPPGEPLVPEVRGEALLYAIAECSVE